MGAISDPIEKASVAVFLALLKRLSARPLRDKFSMALSYRARIFRFIISLNANKPLGTILLLVWIGSQIISNTFYLLDSRQETFNW